MGHNGLNQFFAVNTPNYYSKDMTCGTISLINCGIFAFSRASKSKGQSVFGTCFRFWSLGRIQNSVAGSLRDGPSPSLRMSEPMRDRSKVVEQYCDHMIIVFPERHLCSCLQFHELYMLPQVIEIHKTCAHAALYVPKEWRKTSCTH